MADSLLSFEKVTYCYAKGLPTILHDMSFRLAPKSFTAVVGPSGSGKSTILSLAIGTAQPTRGTVELHARTRMIFQSGGLLPWRTVLDNICLGFNGMQVNPRDAERRARELLKELGIDAQEKKYPRELSGGQRQRVGIARALVSAPELLLLDEPFSALDAETSVHLRTIIDGIFRDKGIGMLMVSHSIDDAVLMADEILVVADGRIIKTVTVPLPRPRSPEDAHVADLIRHVHDLLPRVES